MKSPRDLAPLAMLAVALLAQLAIAAPARADAVVYRLDPEHAAVGFLVDHVGYAKTLGMFRKVSGSFRFDDATATLAELRIEIDAASVFTANDKRDEHLRGRDFLDARRFPKLVFTAGGARRTVDGVFTIEGQLELLGQRRPVTLQATLNKSAPYPLAMAPLQRTGVLGVSARGAFKRSAFGMMYAVENGWVGDEVQLIIEIEARRQ